MARACIVCLAPAQPGSSRCEAHAWRWPTGRRGYGASHARQRAIVLREEPTCRACGAPSTDMDHIVCRALAQVLGWPEERVQARANLQGLCHSCHERKTGQDRKAVRRAKAKAMVSPHG